MHRQRLPVFLASLFLASVVSIPHSVAQCPFSEAAKLTASDADVLDLFGWSVSIDGDVALVGAKLGDGCIHDMSCDSGAAYVYRFNGSKWTQEQKLFAWDTAFNDQFGYSVSIQGDVAVVGAVWDDDACPEDNGCNSGSAYIYRFDGSLWVQEQKLTASDADENDQFGVSVSLSGDVALIGAWKNDGAARISGAAYVYRFNGSTWVEEQKLTASDGDGGDAFGYSVSLSGDAAVIGAYHNLAVIHDEGAAYVFRYNGRTWVEEQKLAASDADIADSFGYSVSISGDVVGVGAYRDDDAGTSSGSAYVYRFNGSKWIEEQKLTASDEAMGDNFGRSLSVSGDLAVVGADRDDDVGHNSGSAYVYRFNGNAWNEEQKLIAADGDNSDEFGQSVFIAGDAALIGAIIDEDGGDKSGSAYLFRINPDLSDPPCGAIDARQPSAPDGSDPAGWDSITMTFEEQPGEMNTEDFVVVTSPPGDAPTVTDVTVDGNTATIHFDDFIPAEAWTTITHLPTGVFTRIGYLPADVNNDKISNANDVLYLIDALNGVIDPAPPSYQTDTDRSGATNANDVLRVIDLLNGAGAYDEFLGAELPA